MSRPLPPSWLVAPDIYVTVLREWQRLLKVKTCR